MSREQLMKEIFSDKVNQSFLGKGLHETSFGSSIIQKTIPNMVSIVYKTISTTQGVKKAIVDTLYSIIEQDNIDDICGAIIEWVLSGLILDAKSLETSDGKYRNVRMATGNKIRKHLLNLEDTPDNSALSIQLIEIALESLSEYVEVEHGYTDRVYLAYRIRPEYMEVISREIKRKSESGFYALPMTTKPVDWDVFVGDNGKLEVVGGYHDIKTKIIRGDKIDMPYSSYTPHFLLANKEPLKALNIIQSTAYRINKKNLERVKNDLIKDPVKPVCSEKVKQYKRDRFAFFQKYPTKEDREAANVEIPEIPVEVLQYDAELAAYKTLVGKLTAAKLAIKIAEMFKDEERIYFPHNFDYRGRIYPIPNTLTPQGDDIAKGLLEFADPVELTDDGLEACYAYLASVYGYDKESYEERFRLGVELASKDVDYREAEEPYVFAQVQDLIRNIEEHGDFTSRIAIAIDGSCNGLQHMAAITMDAKGGQYVNVGPASCRRDIYMEIAMSTAELVKHDIDNGIYDDEEDKLTLEAIYSIISGKNARKIAKQPVMINPYGGTFMGYKDYILKSLQEFHPEHSTNKNATRLTQYVVRAMSDKLTGGTKYQEWVRKTFSGVARLGILPQFETPDGFLVRNYSMKVEQNQKHISSLVNRNGKTTFSVTKRTEEINSRKIGTRAQPNIIHALDATHLRMTAIECSNEGIDQLWFIHDSFASNPNNYKALNRITREQFIKMYDPENVKHPINVITSRLSRLIKYKGKDFVFDDFPVFKDDNRLQLKEVINNEFFFA